MPKSYKILGDGNYIDSTGVAHNKVALNTVITNLQNADISAINNLTSTDTKNALSAAQGKILNEKIEDRSPVLISSLDSIADIASKLTNVIGGAVASGDIKLNSMVFLQSDVDESSWVPLQEAYNEGSAAVFVFVGYVGNNIVKETITVTSSTACTRATETIGVVIKTIQDNINGGASGNVALHANQGKTLNDKIVALEARIAALEAGEIELATDPDDTDEMNVWIQTS